MEFHFSPPQTVKFSIFSEKGKHELQEHNVNLWEININALAFSTQ